MHEGQGSEDQSPGRPGAWPPLPDGGDSSGPDQAPGPMTDGSMPDQQGWAAAAPAAPAASIVVRAASPSALPACKPVPT